MRGIRVARVVAGLACIARAAGAQPAPAPAPAPPAPPPPAPPAPPPPAPPHEPRPSGFSLGRISIHGFASEGAFISTANNYIGESSRGTAEFLEAGINFSAQLTDKLRVGLQFFSQDEGTANDATPRLDWGFLDYHWKTWLGVRVGRVRIPFGLYNEYLDIDAGRVPILLPQSVYPISNRLLLTAQTGGDIYGTVSLAKAGELDYQIYGGVLSEPLVGQQDPGNSRLYAYDSKYVLGASAFWHPPIEGLRVGASYMRGSLDADVALSSSYAAGLIAAGLVPPTFNGDVVVGFRPLQLWIASAEYTRGDWTLAAEYSRWMIHGTYAPAILPADDTDEERFYGMLTYRADEHISASGYYSVVNSNVHERGGHDKAFAQPYYEWSRDAAATVRLDVNDHWLWKLEAHFIDGTAALDPTLNPTPTRFWGLFLLRTTVTF